jgi:peptide/nickel transport system permease protein
MIAYLTRRLLLLPLTLFCILLVNFVVINLAPGDPTSQTEVSQDGGAQRQESQAQGSAESDRYLQFREHYGLTLPILFNTWPSLERSQVLEHLQQLESKEWVAGTAQKMSVKEHDALRVKTGDQARYTMPHLLSLAEDETLLPAVRQLAVRFFIRGGTRQGHLGPGISTEQRQENRQIAEDNHFLRGLKLSNHASREEWQSRLAAMRQWYEARKVALRFEPDFGQKVEIFFFESRFSRYLGRVLTLDFGTLRNDENRTVIREVSKRFKYSLTLAILPMFITFALCQCFGFYMAYRHGRFPDLFLNVLFLILYATPVFVVAPFLIEKVALNHTFPFSDTPIPTGGFTSPERYYSLMTSKERLFDILRHIALPLVAVMYGGLAAQSRLSRTAVLEVMRQDYVRTARAKGLPESRVMIKHVGRNAAITIVTAIAGSLGVVLGGSLVIETIFEINGFGKFFYEAILNRDYNVIMFSALASAALTLIGYLVADIAYTLLDPRVSLE